jgi:hypothetical protein
MDIRDIVGFTANEDMWIEAFLLNHLSGDGNEGGVFQFVK